MKEFDPLIDPTTPTKRNYIYVMIGNCWKPMAVSETAYKAVVAKLEKFRILATKNCGPKE
jgi:hypothetical protein